MTRRPAPPGRIYGGYRGVHDHCTVGWEDPDGHREMLDLRLDLESHSPSGFNWGYAGSGPAQLALALVADATGDDYLAKMVHQRFKEEIIAPIEGRSWILIAENIAAFARSLCVATVVK